MFNTQVAIRDGAGCMKAIRQTVSLKEIWLYISRRKYKFFTLTNLGASQVISIFVGLISGVLITRNVSTEIYGQYQVVLSLIAVISSFCLNGMGQSITISAARRYDGNLLRIMKLKFGAYFLGSVALIVSGILYYQSQPSLAYGIFAVALLFPFYKLQGIWPVWLKGRGKLNCLALFSIAISLLSLTVLVILVFSNNISLHFLLARYIGVPLLFSIGILIYILRNRTNTLEDDDTIKYGLHVSAAYFLGGLVSSDKIIINNYLSASDVAIYAVALTFPLQIKTWYTIFNQMITPNIYKANSVAEAWKYLKNKLAIIILFFLLLGLTGFIVLPILIPLLFSDRYAAAVPYGRWLWLSWALLIPASYLGNVLGAQKKVGFVYGVSIGHPILQFVLYMVLIVYGLPGMVLARIITRLTLAVVQVGAFFYCLSEERRNSQSLA